jgi:hypothetical protein
VCESGLVQVHPCVSPLLSGHPGPPGHVFDCGYTVGARVLVHVLLLCWGWFACGGRWWCGQLSAPHPSQASSCRAGHCPRPHGMQQAYHTACSSRLQRACALPVIAKPSRESVCLAFRVIQERVSFQHVAAPHRPCCSVPCECRRLPLPGEGLPCTSELASACCNASSGAVAAKLLR